MSSRIFSCCCWPCFKSSKKSISTTHEDVPLLDVCSDPQSINKVHPTDVNDKEDFKYVSLKLSKHKLHDTSDGAGEARLKTKFTLEEQKSEDDEWEIPTGKKVPLWQQIERIKSPADGRPPTWNSDR